MPSFEMRARKKETLYTKLSNEDDDDDGEKAKVRSVDNRSPYEGCLFAVASALFQITTTTLIKSLSTFTSSEISWYRSVIQASLCLPLLVYRRSKFVYFPFVGLLTLRCVLLSSRFLARIFAIKSLPLTDSNAILFSNPIAVAIVARFTLKEPFTQGRALTLVTNLIGVVCVSRFWTFSGSDVERAYGVGAAVVSVFIQAVSQVILKKLTYDLSPDMVVFHLAWMRSFMMFGLTEALNGFALPHIPSCSYFFYLSEPILLVSLGVTSFAMQSCQAKAVKLESPSTVAAIVSSIVLPLSFLLETTVFQSELSVFTIIGACLVLLGSFMMSFAKYVDTLPLNSKLKGKFSFLNE